MTPRLTSIKGGERSTTSIHYFEWIRRPIKVKSEWPLCMYPLSVSVPYRGIGPNLILDPHVRRGAGIGGLTLSAALGALQRGSESTLEVDIYESASVISEIGAGITLWPRVWKIMQAIGLGESLVKFLPKPPDNSPRTHRS
jgi:hypothetical protein